MTKSTISEMALHVALGQSSPHLECPYCSGGQSREKSFKIWRNADGVSYKCYRVKCGVGGKISGVGGGLVETTEEVTKSKLRPYTKPTRPLSDKELEYVWATWGLSEDDVSKQELSTELTTGRIVFPTFTKEGWEWGKQARAVDGKQPKCSLYWQSEYKERLHFPRVFRRSDLSLSTTLIVAEDIPSAIRVAAFLPSAALLGTSLTASQVEYLRDGFSTVYLALDADATEKAIKYKKRYGLMFDKFEVVPLTKDIKNMSHKELTELMQSIGVIK